MRRTFVLGLGLTGWLAGSAIGQFGSPPAAAPPAPFGGGVPIGSPSIPTIPSAPMAPSTGSYVAPVGGLQPANSFRPAGTPAARPVAPVEIPLALGPNHSMLVKPEDGAYFICVKSYSRPHNPDENEKGYTVKELAEALANDIQQTQRARVFLYELVSDEKKAQATARAAARQRANEFEAALASYKQKSELQGMEFYLPDQAVKYQTFHYRDQVAVLVGGYKTEDDAVKALGAIKKWPMPKDTRLMDGGSIATRKPDGKIEIEKSFLNPYAQAMVVQNPAIAKQISTQPVPLDPLIIKLNEDRPYSLLKTTKRWTIAVKSFSAPVHYQSKDDDGSVMKRIGMSKGADILRASAEQAEALAKALREMKDKAGNSLMLEAYVLHTRTASLVTVGQYDSPNDPELIEKQRILTHLTFNTSKDEKGSQLMGPPGQKLFGDTANTIMPVPIPRH